MDKNDILDYVTETPGNTNRAVLGSMLDQMADGGGGGESSSFKVSIEMDTSTMTATADKTYTEIMEAYNSGSYVYGEVTIADDTIILKASSYTSDDEDGIYFVGIANKLSNQSTILMIEARVYVSSFNNEDMCEVIPYTISRTLAE